MNKAKSTYKIDTNLGLMLNSSISLFCGHMLLNDIKQIYTTKKSLWSLENKKYTFLISPCMTKPFIKLGMKNYFNARIKKINTLNLPIKKKYIGRSIGFKSKFKKAIVKFKHTDEIAFFSDI